jgi:hypothetical protein
VPVPHDREVEGRHAEDLPHASPQLPQAPRSHVQSHLVHGVHRGMRKRRSASTASTSKGPRAPHAASSPLYDSGCACELPPANAMFRKYVTAPYMIDDRVTQRNPPASPRSLDLASAVPMASLKIVIGQGPTASTSCLPSVPPDRRPQVSQPPHTQEWHSPRGT